MSIWNKYVYPKPLHFGKVRISLYEKPVMNKNILSILLHYMIWINLVHWKKQNKCPIIPSDIHSYFVDTISPVLSTHPFNNDKVASLEWDNIVAFYYFTVSKIWSDKSGGFWLEWSDKREGYCIWLL